MTSYRAPAVTLRELRADDLPILFEQQRDPEANYKVGFTAPDPSDRAAYIQRWTDILHDEKILKRTILYQARIVGSVVLFEMFGETEVGYWLGKEFWGKGIATQAVTQFLAQISLRPLYARIAYDNHASRRVLEKCGFVYCGENTDYANARGQVIQEFIFRLDAA